MHPCSPVPLVPGSPGASQSTLALNPSPAQTYSPQTHLPTPQHHAKGAIAKTSLTAPSRTASLLCAALIIPDLRTPLCSSHPSSSGCQGRVYFKPPSLPSIKITDFPQNNSTDLENVLVIWGGHILFLCHCRWVPLNFLDRHPKTWWDGGSLRFNRRFWRQHTARLCVSNRRQGKLNTTLGEAGV